MGGVLTLKRTFGPKLLTSALTTTVYNGGSEALYDLIQQLHIVNKTGVDANFSLWLGAMGSNAAGTELFIREIVKAYDVFDWEGPLKMRAADFLVGGASADSTLVITGSGEQYPDLGYTGPFNAAPTFVNAGTPAVGGNVFLPGATPGLPSSRVNGNLLIAVAVQVPGGASFTWSAGWNSGDSVSDANSHAEWRWCFVTGSETAPTVFGSGGNGAVQVFQYTGTVASSPIGAVNHMTEYGTTLMSASLTTAGRNSLVVALLATDSEEAWGPGTPSGWSNESQEASGDGSIQADDKVVANPGTATGGFSYGLQGTQGSTAFQIELKAN